MLTGTSVRFTKHSVNAAKVPDDVRSHLKEMYAGVQAAIAPLLHQGWLQYPRDGKPHSTAIPLYRHAHFVQKTKLPNSRLFDELVYQRWCSHMRTYSMSAHAS